VSERGPWFSAHGAVDTALWALVVAFVIFFAVMVAPKMPEYRAKQELIRARQIAAEHDGYCRKWGMAPGTHEHTVCAMDLQEFRTRVEQRVVDETSF